LWTADDVLGLRFGADVLHGDLAPGVRDGVVSDTLGRWQQKLRRSLVQRSGAWASPVEGWSRAGRQRPGQRRLQWSHLPQPLHRSALGSGLDVAGQVVDALEDAAQLDLDGLGPLAVGQQ
jgi:hypothetical protein